MPRVGDYDSLFYARRVVPCNCDEAYSKRGMTAPDCLWHEGAKPAIHALIDAGYIPLANPTTQQAWEMLEQAVDASQYVDPNSTAYVQPVMVAANAFVAALKDAQNAPRRVVLVPEDEDDEWDAYG